MGGNDDTKLTITGVSTTMILIMVNLIRLKGDYNISIHSLNLNKNSGIEWANRAYKCLITKWLEKRRVGRHSLMSKHYKNAHIRNV